MPLTPPLPASTATPSFPPADAAMDPADLATLRQAIVDLDHDSLASRVTRAVGKQVSLVGRLLPAQMAETVARGTDAAMKTAMRVALSSLRGKPLDPSRSERLHKVAVALSGATGGVFGLASLPIELPVSTTIMLRSIAEIARANGEDLAGPDAVLACLEVFALGSDAADEPLTEGGYFAARGLMAKSVSEAARYLAQRSIVDEAAPALLRFMSQVGARFGVVVSQKAAAQSLPLIGAAGGAAINYAFIAHFQAVARGHFTVRRLERRYGAGVVRAAYTALSAGRQIAA